MLLSVEPTKQKTRRPERRGITRAVSPKKMREEKGNVEAQERRRKRRPGTTIGAVRGLLAVASGLRRSLIQGELDSRAFRRSTAFWFCGLSASDRL